jgi:hypothetical protein
VGNDVGNAVGIDVGILEGSVVFDIDGMLVGFGSGLLNRLAVVVGSAVGDGAI